jgi:hypothetical protein
MTLWQVKCTVWKAIPLKNLKFKYEAYNQLVILLTVKCSPTLGFTEPYHLKPMAMLRDDPFKHESCRF